VTNEEDEQNLQTNCDSIVQYLESEGLKVNASKTKMLLTSVSPTGSSPLINPPTLNGMQIEQVKSLKYLGIDFDERINFEHHAVRVANKARRMLHAVGNTLRKWCMRTEIGRAYQMCIRPV
jgi:hypothetical protein